MPAWQENKKDKEVIDASPSSTPQNITETKAWKASSKGMQRFWFNYKTMLTQSFQRMSRQEQEDLVTRFSLIMTIGATIVMLNLFYGVIPFRILSVLGALAAAYFIGSKIVAKVILTRMEDHLNKE